MNRPLLIAALAVAVSAAKPAAAQHTEISPVEISSVNTRLTQIGPVAWFTGTAFIDPLFGPTGTRQVGGALVTFAPGARTVWHSHPAGQTLIVTDGVGWVQSRGGERREIRAGDVIWTPPGVEHWHGGTMDHRMVHIAIQEAIDGEVVTWLEPVTDAEYVGNLK